MDDISRITMPVAPNAKRKKDPPQPIFDTPDSDQAIRRPSAVLTTYHCRTEEVWLSPSSAQIADRIVETLSAGQGPVWTTLIGPFGFGKSATAAALWRRLDETGKLLTAPPISATSTVSLFDAVVSLLKAAAGDRRKVVEAAYSKANGTKRSGSFNKQPADVMVEFLRLLCGPKGPFAHGVVLCIDEVQQFLGPLDPSALQSLRALVWGLRTERINCAVILTLDPLLYRRLDRWASDILHRIADRGEVLDLRAAYDSEFVSWLWGRWVDHLGLTEGRVLDEDLAIALGQYVEREDLANGPRTVVEVFRRVINYHGCYSLSHFVKDLKSGVFRFFSGSLNAHSLVNGILEDAWVNESPERRHFVEQLSGFPNGIPSRTLNRLFPQSKVRESVRRELFGPLLVNAAHGLALEALQRVRRKTWELDELVLHCWETLPALDSLMEHAPRLLSSTLVDWWFGTHAEACGHWHKLTVEDESEFYWEGEFDQDFPDRRIKIEILDRENIDQTRTDVDMVIRFLVCTWGSPECITKISDDPGVPILLQVTLPLLPPIQELSASIERYNKFLDPEPIRPIHLLAALADLNKHLDDSEIPQPLRQRVNSFYRETCDLLGSTLLKGEYAEDGSPKLEIEGTRLIRAHANRAFRQRFPNYRPIRRIPRWREELARYRRALSASDLSPEVRMGVVPVEGMKADVLKRLEQQSVAAGDSLVRSLQGLIRVEGNKNNYRLWFKTHDLEDWVIRSLRQQQLPRASLEDILRCHGCSVEEATEVVSLLLARGAIEKNVNGLFIPSNLKTQINAPTNCHLKSSLEEMLEQEYYALIEQRLIRAVATLRSLEVLDIPTSSALSKHIEAHIRDITKRISLTIDKARSLRIRIGKGCNRLPRGELGRRTAEIEETVDRITENFKLCRHWSHASVVFAGLERRVVHLESPESGALANLLKDLNQCTRYWRELFATDSTEALHRYQDFLNEILTIDRCLDEHLLDQRIAFDRRRRDLVQILGWAALEPAPWGLEGGDPTPFASLDRWTLSTARRAHDRMKSAFRPGRWKDPQGTKVSFGELHKRVEPVLEAAKRDSTNIEELVSQIKRLKGGFENEFQIERIYNDPASGPDFERLAHSFLSGEIEIIIRPRSTEGKA